MKDGLQLGYYYLGGESSTFDRWLPARWEVSGGGVETWLRRHLDLGSSLDGI